MKKIYIAYTGGTFGMKPDPSGYLPDRGLANALAAALPPVGEAGMPEWHLHEYPRLIDSAEAHPRDWHTIAADIATHYDDFDGFVVVHGTDTMAYTAAALSFALAGVRKPVIVTGAQIPLVMPRSDALANLLGAMLIAAQQPIPEVCLFFNGLLLRGNRATKVSGVDFDAFASPNYPPLGKAGIDLSIDVKHTLPMPDREAFVLKPPGQHEVAVFTLHPGLSPARLEQWLAPPLGALVLRTYGAGNGPVSMPGFVSALAAASARGTIIVNITQCARGRVEQGKYASGSPLTQAGVVSGQDMTLEATVTKLHHLLTQGLDGEPLRAEFLRNHCGELSPCA